MLLILLFALAFSFGGLFYLYLQLLNRMGELEKQLLAVKENQDDIQTQNHQIALMISETPKKEEKKVERKKLPGANRRPRTAEEKERARQQAKERWAKKKAAQVMQPQMINHASITTVSAVS